MDQAHLSALELGKNWRAGFDVEVILGDLGEKRFSEFIMDEATPAYCQAVARELSRLTGLSWTAPRAGKRKPGFHVLPEYDLDPLEFEDTGMIGGVELLTPPLPLDEAEEVREKIADAVQELDEGTNGENHPARGWHINIDPGRSSEWGDNSRFVAGKTGVVYIKISCILDIWIQRMLLRRYQRLARKRDLTSFACSSKRDQKASSPERSPKTWEYGRIRCQPISRFCTKQGSSGISAKDVQSGTSQIWKGWESCSAS